MCMQEAENKNVSCSLKIQKFLKNMRFKCLFLLTGCSLAACTIVPNEGPTSCGLESMDNALFRDAGCDPITGIVSLPSLVLVWVVDYSSCGLKWHNSRVAPDFNGKKQRYIRRLRQLKLEMERNQSALKAQKALAAQTLAANAIADHIDMIMRHKNETENKPLLTMKDNHSAKILAENALGARFAKAYEQMLQIRSNLQLAQDRALASMPQDQDILPALADPGQKEASSYSVLELEKIAWAEVTADDKKERAKRRAEKIAKWSPERKAAFEAKEKAREHKKQLMEEKKRLKQEKRQKAAETKQAEKTAKEQAKRAEKGELRPVPMNKAPQQTSPQTAKAQPEQTQKQAVAEPSQSPVAPIVRNPETIRPTAQMKAAIQLTKTMPLPLKINEK